MFGSSSCESPRRTPGSMLETPSPISVNGNHTSTFSPAEQHSQVAQAASLGGPWQQQAQAAALAAAINSDALSAQDIAYLTALRSQAQSQQQQQYQHQHLHNAGGGGNSIRDFSLTPHAQSLQHPRQHGPAGGYHTHSSPTRHLSYPGGPGGGGGGAGMPGGEAYHGGYGGAGGGPVSWSPMASPSAMHAPPRSSHMGGSSHFGPARMGMHDRGGGRDNGSGASVYDMKSLTGAIGMVQSGTGDIRRIFQSATFGPRLPGLTKLVSQLTREGHWSKGLEVFDSLDVVGLRPDTTITNAAISACDKGGQWEKAMQIFGHMNDWGLPRDAITYSAVISALSKGRQWSLAIDVFNHMCDSGVECDAVTCCSLITALDKGGQWQLAEQVFMQMYSEHPTFKVLLQCMNEDAVTPSVCTGPTTPVTPANSRPAFAPGSLPPSHAPGMDPAAGPFEATIGRFQGMSSTPPGMLNNMNSGSIWGAPSSSSSTKSFRPSNFSEAGGGFESIHEDHATPPTGAAAEGTAAAGELWAQSKDPVVHGFGNRQQLLLPSSGSGSFGIGSGSGNNMVALATGGSAALDSEDGEGRTLPLIRSPSMSGPNAGRDPTQALLSQASLSALIGNNGQPSPLNMMNPWPGGLADLCSPVLGPRDASQQLMTLSGMHLGAGGNGLPGMMSPRHSMGEGNAFQPPLSPGGPAPRTTSAPPYQRGLLRTSSLNTKKSAPNRVCCNALLAAYARASPTQWQKAIRLLELMWQCGGELCPDIVSYNTVIKACGNAMQIELGFKVYVLMRKRGIEPTVATYGTLICIASDAQQSARVKEAWGWLRASGLEVHVTCVNAYLGALLKDNDWEDAERLFVSLLRPSGCAKPNAITFNLMMSAYLARELPERVQGLFEEMYNAGVQPSVNTYTTLITAYLARRCWADAVNVLQYMCRPESSVRPSVGTFTGIFVALRDAALAMPPEARRELAHWVHQVRTTIKSHSHLHPDVAAYRAMVGAFQAVGEADVVLELFNAMVGHNLAVDADTAAAVLAAVCACKAWDKAVQLLKVLQETGPRLLPDTVRDVLMAIAEDKAWIHVYCVLKVCSSSGVAEPLLALLKEEGRTELLFMALLVSKEHCGEWREALEMWTWMQQEQKQSALTHSREVYRIMFELLVVRGGSEGLREAVLMCKRAHDAGILGSYLPLGLPTPQANTATAEDGNIAIDGGGAVRAAALQQELLAHHIVALEGYSRIEVTVTLMAWAIMVFQASLRGVYIQPMFVEIVTTSSMDSLSTRHVRPAMAMVLEGGCAELIGGKPNLQGTIQDMNLGQIQGSLFGTTAGGSASASADNGNLDAWSDVCVLRRPVVYFSDPNHPAVVHVQTASVYAAMDLPAEVMQAMQAVDGQQGVAATAAAMDQASTNAAAVEAGGGGGANVGRGMSVPPGNPPALPAKVLGHPA